MAENVLEKIIKKKSEKIVNLKKTISLDSLNELINTNKTFIDFKEKIENNIKEKKFSIIAEIKKASPSAGVIIKDYDPIKISNMWWFIEAKLFSKSGNSLRQCCLAKHSLTKITRQHLYRNKDNN